jgi:hypothetical protein
MKTLTFEQRNRLKMELYSNVNEVRKREIISQLLADEEYSRVLDYRDEWGDEGF